MPVQDIETNDQPPPLPLLRVLQRRFPYQLEQMTTNDVADREKEVKLFVLSILNEVISDALKKSTTDQEGLA